MSEKLPILCSAHHDSDNFGEFADRCALTPEQRKRYSDYGTKETVPSKGMYQPLISTHSRGIIDLNRELTSPTLFPKKDFGKPTPNEIWKPGQELTEAEREKILNEIYLPYHASLLKRICEFERTGILVAWDNTAHYPISKEETGEKEMMPPFILSNRGTRDSTDMTNVDELDARKENIRTTTCDPRFLEEFAIELRKFLKEAGLPDDVFYNRVYKGNHICEYYNTRRHPELNAAHEVQSFQIEYDTLLTHDQETLAPDYDAMNKLRIAVERALIKAYANLLTCNY